MLVPVDHDTVYFDYTFSGRRKYRIHRRKAAEWYETSSKRLSPKRFERALRCHIELERSVFEYLRLSGIPIITTKPERTSTSNPPPPNNNNGCNDAPNDASSSGRYNLRERSPKQTRRGVAVAAAAAGRNSRKGRRASSRAARRKSTKKKTGTKNRGARK